MSALAQLQRDFQRHILSGDTAIVQRVRGSRPADAAARLGIYAEAYRLRLIDALASNCPRLQQLLGTEAFAMLARRYIDLHPSQFASIRWFGAQLADVAAAEHPAQPWLSDLARWEWAVATAFDAADAATAGIETLGEVAPQRWPALRFHFHPSLQRLAMTTNAPALFKALTDDAVPPEPCMLEQQQWVIWRQELKTHYRSLANSDAAALDALRDGATFEQMCETLCDWHDPQEIPARAASLLRQCVLDGLVTEVI